MPERRPLRFKIPSEKLALIQQHMDGVKKKPRKTRVLWKPGEKEAMIACREQHLDLSMKQFQQEFYPERSVKNLAMIISKSKGDPSKREETKTGSEDRCRSNTPRLTRLKRPRKSGPFEYSDSEEEDSNPDERIEDISPSGLRTPNKYIKVSHSAEAQSPPNRYERHRDPRIRSQTDEAPQIPKETVALAYRPQTTPPETTSVAQGTGCSDSSSSSTGMSPIVLDISLEQPPECHGTKMQVDDIQDEPQQQTKLQDLKQEELFPEHCLRQDFAKNAAYVFASAQSMCRTQETSFAIISEIRAQNSILQRDYDTMKQDNDLMKKQIDRMKTEKEVEIAQINEKWQREVDSLVQKNAILDKRFEMMKSAFEWKLEE